MRPLASWLVVLLAGCPSAQQSVATKPPAPPQRITIGAAAPAPWPDQSPWRDRLHVPGTPPAGHEPPEVEEPEHEHEQEDDAEDQDLKQCPVTLDACPITGCAVPGNGKARSNEIKHGDPARSHDNVPLVVPVSVFRDLQVAADQRLPQGEYPIAHAREQLRTLEIAGARLGEGMTVKVTGYLVAMRPEGPESVNCKLKHKANNDFHISLVEDPADDEYRSIVVEMIPQDRPAAWDTPTFHQLIKRGTQVLVVGHLFYDAKHVVNDHAPPHRGQPKRFSLWEVHPITKFYTCARTACDPSSPDGWTELR